MSKLEKFINDNRDQMDDSNPSYGVWEQIDAAMDKKKKRSFVLAPFMKWGIAASVLIMVGLGGYFIAKQDTSSGPVKNGADTGQSSLADAPEVVPFAKMIAAKQEELKLLSKDQPELYDQFKDANEQFTNDINQLDSSYKALYQQLNTSTNREVLIEEMIQNLQLQLQVLNQQLNIIHQIKDSSYSHEKVI